MVSIRYPELICISPRIWKRRELLERTHMGTDELPGSPSTTQCSLTCHGSNIPISWYCFFCRPMRPRKVRIKQKHRRYTKNYGETWSTTSSRWDIYIYENLVFRPNTIQIRNTNVPDMCGNNTMLLQARDEEGISYIYSSVNICLLPFAFISHPFTGWTSLTALSEFNPSLPLRLA